MGGGRGGSIEGVPPDMSGGPLQLETPDPVEMIVVRAGHHHRLRLGNQWLDVDAVHLSRSRSTEGTYDCRQSHHRLTQRA